MNLLKLISVLMDYPEDELWQHGAELQAAVADPALAASQRAALGGFVDELLRTDAMQAQDRWLSTFDRGRSMSLLIFEHIHGESRDRGQAMVDLMQAYRKNGFELAAKELPDYLPLLLEYLALRPEVEVRDWLSNITHILGLLAARAAERQSPYAPLFDLLIHSADGKLDLGALRQRAGEEPRDDTPEAMDRQWEEEIVRFGVEMNGQDTAANCAPTRTHTRQVNP